MELILVRHGETEYNRADLFRGRVDLPLNERGRLQAEAAGRRLSGLSFEGFYSSPLLRAVETAQHIAAPHRGKVTTLDEFIDVDYGLWSGKGVEEIREAWPEEFRLWVEDPGKVIFPGGESLTEVRVRLERGLDELKSKHRGRVLLVGHKVVNRLLLCIILGLDTSGFWKLEQDNGAINTIRWEDTRGWVLVRMNDVSHLEGLGSLPQRT